MTGPGGVATAAAVDVDVDVDVDAVVVPGRQERWQYCNLPVVPHGHRHVALDEGAPELHRPGGRPRPHPRPPRGRRPLVPRRRPRQVPPAQPAPGPSAVQPRPPVRPARKQARAGVIPRAGVHARAAVRVRDPPPETHGRAVVEAHRSVGAHARERQAVRAVPQAVHHDGTAAAAAAALVAHMQQRWWGVSCGGVGGAAMQTLGRRGCYGWKCSYSAKLAERW